MSLRRGIALSRAETMTFIPYIPEIVLKGLSTLKDLKALIFDLELPEPDEEELENSTMIVTKPLTTITKSRMFHVSLR